MMQILLDSVSEHETTVLLSSHVVSELESICDNLIILSKSQVQIAGTVASLLANHHVLTGPAATATFGSLNVISSTVAGRHGTYLIEGVVGPLDDDWQVVSPDLEEIVLAYLEHPIENRTPPPGASEGGPS
jgi:ABC-2 type transport system ATP-binding protein